VRVLAGAPQKFGASRPLLAARGTPFTFV
jgi:hypothetical protein